MHGHAHEQLDGEGLRPKAAGLRDRDEAALWKAAAAGRPDVLGSDGMLRLQRAVGNAGARTLAGQRSPVLDVVGSGGGQPLDEPLRADMESRLGADFGDVRVHIGDTAHQSAVAVGAHAYTVGSNVVFQRDAYDPGSTAGRTMIAHELTHVVQQRSGPVDGTSTGDGVRVSDPSDRFEREAAANAERVMAMPAPVAATAAPSAATAQGAFVGGAPVQREAAEEEETAQGAFVGGASVQREAAEEEETAQGAFVGGASVQREAAEEEETSG